MVRKSLLPSCRCRTVRLQSHKWSFPMASCRLRRYGVVVHEPVHWKRKRRSKSRTTSWWNQIWKGYVILSQAVSLVHCFISSFFTEIRLKKYICEAQPKFIAFILRSNYGWFRMRRLRKVENRRRRNGGCTSDPLSTSLVTSSDCEWV